MADELFDQEVIERRIVATQAVRQVVHAIWALARAQLPRIEDAVAEATVYLDWVDEVVADIAGAARAGADRDEVWVLLGPERAYCGGLARQLVEQIPPGGSLGLVGQRLIEMVDAEPLIATRVLFALPGATSPDEAEEVGHTIAGAILERARGAHVELLHPTAGTSTLHRVVLLAGEVLPSLRPPETFSALHDVLDAAVAEALAGRLTVAVLEAIRAEVRARVGASEHAKQACDARLEVLEERWRVARQERITSELLEVVAGSHAATGAGA